MSRRSKRNRRRAHKEAEVKRKRQATVRLQRHLDETGWLINRVDEPADDLDLVKIRCP